MYIAGMEYNFIGEAHGVLTMILLEMLSFLVLIIVHHLMLTVARRTF